MSKKTKNCSEEKEHACECECEDIYDTKSKEAEYLELAQRIKAEFDNYKKRNAEISTQSFENGITHTIAKLLPAMDSFKQAKATIADEKVLEGVELIIEQIFGAFDQLGVTKIDAQDQMFDPEYHNAVLTANDETKPDGTILEEYQEGFIFKNERVIRHSVVKINKIEG